MFDYNSEDGLITEPRPAQLMLRSPAAAPCRCAGCPGRELSDENSNKVAGGGGGEAEQEDYLDTLDRKVTEIINRDSRRSSTHDLVSKEDTELYGPLSSLPAYPHTRNRLSGDFNCNPRYYIHRYGEENICTIKKYLITLVIIELMLCQTPGPRGCDHVRG